MNENQEREIEELKAKLAARDTAIAEYIRLPDGRIISATCQCHVCKTALAAITELEKQS